MAGTLIKLDRLAEYSQKVYGFSGADIQACYDNRATVYEGELGTWIWGTTASGKPIAVLVNEDANPVVVEDVRDHPPFNEIYRAR